MSKKSIFTILTVVFICCAGVFINGAFAATLTPENKTARFKVEISFEKSPPTITHYPVTRVSVNARTLVVVGNVAIADGAENLPESNAVYLEYELSDDPGNVLTASAAYRKESSGYYSFVSSPIVVNRGGKGNEVNINYRIVANSGGFSSGYYPSSTSYITAEITPSTMAVAGMDGLPFVLQSGDQTRGDSYVQFHYGALLSAPSLIIQELYTGNDALPSLEPVQPVITYHFMPDNVAVKNNLRPVISLYYGDLPLDINNIEVKWFNNAGKWQDVKFTNDTAKRTALVNLAATQTDLGYYAIFSRTQSPETGFGPDKRVIAPYEKIKFRGLQEGDVVKIYNSRGKNIKTLDSPPFEWNADSSSGGKVETGSYIYQMKKDGKTTSGTVVVVR
ncbi:MAG: hypothetical protein LBU09_00265 [Endomicrobium sp.]|jgi:hypothetical protein|nr:hypothetical protein [Endomicrobium sp.]